MRKLLRMVTLSASAVTMAVMLAPSAALAGSHGGDDAKKDDPIAKGKDIAWDRKKGNCLACHMIVGGDLPGTIGPPLIAMKARFPDRDKLRAQIYDPRTANPDTIMLPYGPHGIMTEEEIDLVTDYVLTL